MTELVNNTGNSLIELVEEYVSRKRNRQALDSGYFRNSLRRLGYFDDQVRDLLIEMDDDTDRELLGGDGIVKARVKLIISLLTAFVGITLSIVGAAGSFGAVSLGLIIIPLGLIAASLSVAGKAFAEIGLVQKRKRRRFMKYQKWA